MPNSSVKWSLVTEPDEEAKVLWTFDLGEAIDSNIITREIYLHAQSNCGHYGGEDPFVGFTPIMGVPRIYQGSTI